MKSLLRRQSRLLVSCLLIAISACREVDAPPPAAVADDPELSLVAGSLRGLPGDTVAVTMTGSALDGSGLIGFQGRLDFDPGRLRYVGQPMAGGTLVLVNGDSANAGGLRYLAYNHQRVRPGDVMLVFEVLSTDYAGTLRLTVDEAVTPGLRKANVRAGGAISEDSAYGTGSAVAFRTVLDWVGHLGWSERAPVGGPRRAPGEGTVYGDASENGTVSSFDAAIVANVAVGNLPLLTDGSKDYVIAGNVAPTNPPGLGEFGDTNPPGRNSDGSYTITVLDLAIIRSEVLGVDDPVVGAAIPGRVLAPNRVIVSGTIDSGVTRTMTKDTIYELRGTVKVRRRGVLIIQPGTRIEGDSATRGALLVAPGGLLQAVGSRVEPIVFTCSAAIKTRGCWGGIQLAGYSFMNNGVTHEGDDVIGCPVKQIPGDTGFYGGCRIGDTTGVLRYARVEYAGQMVTAGIPVPGLSLLGVGFGTVIDSVQVYGSASDGLLVSGGTAEFRYLVLSNNLSSGLRWDDGWNGRAQFVVIQQDMGNGDAIRGSNFGGNHNATPRSRPILYNLTISGGAGTNSAAGIVLENGTDAELRNLVVIREAGAGFDIQGQETCNRAQLPNGIVLTHSVFFMSNPDFAADPDCIDESAYALDPLRLNRVLDPLLMEPFGTRSPDFRPATTSPLSNGYAVPPNDGFFVPATAFIGAMPPANVTMNVIPWYPGWTRGWNGAP